MSTFFEQEGDVSGKAGNVVSIFHEMLLEIRRRRDKMSGQRQARRGGHALPLDEMGIIAFGFRPRVLPAPAVATRVYRVARRMTRIHHRVLVRPSQRRAGFLLPR